MFARFKNLFSKNKSESEEAHISAESISTLRTSFKIQSVYGNDSSNTDPSKLEGLNLLKSIVENEQNVVTKANPPATSLSEEVAELLKRRLSQGHDVNNTDVELAQENLGSDQASYNHTNGEKKLEEKQTEPINSDFREESKESLTMLQDNDEMPKESSLTVLKDNTDREISASEQPNHKTSKQNTTDNEVKEIIESKNRDESDQISLENSSDHDKMEINSEKPFDNVLDLNASEDINLNDGSDNLKQTPRETQNEVTTNGGQENPLNLSEHNSNNKESDNIPTSTTLSHENSPDLTDSSKSLSQSSVKENCNKSSIENSSLSSSEINTSPTTNSSIVVEDIPSEINTSSPTVDSTISGSSSSNTSTLDTAAAINEIIDPSKIIVNPIDNNGLACTSITNKLTDIGEVAESLDAVIREVQENVQSVELESNPSPSDKKMGTLRSTSSEDWHSRSTEDDSFATASEGNFTPHSHSSASFQTASGRTSSFISCDKNSFDASEADDSTFAFEMPELTSPHNMSFEGSEQSYLSAQPTINGEDNEKTPTKLSESSSQTAQPLEEDQSSIADIEDLHSESVTPTPAETIEEYLGDSIQIESETELEIAGIADAPTMEILTEHSALPMSRTPEVSLSNAMASTNSNNHVQMNSNEARDSTEQETNENTNNNNNNKPNAAWRRSKYYENITKQTIKGFL